MRTALVLLSALVWFGGIRAGAREGRNGNELLAVGDAEAAEAYFLAGIAKPGVPIPFLARLHHNLGLAFGRQGNAATADSAFVTAMELALDPEDRARFAYNAGTAALIEDEWELAAQHLRRSLVLNPNQALARRNLELALRALDAQRDPEQPEPSDFAKRLKERADALVEQRAYPDALELMNDGLERDSTVAAYSDFIGRLAGVSNIEIQLPEGSAPDTSAIDR